MVFVKHTYGSHAKQIKDLQRKRLRIKNKQRYYSVQIGECDRRLLELEERIDYYKRVTGEKKG